MINIQDLRVAFVNDKYLLYYIHIDFPSYKDFLRIKGDMSNSDFIIYCAKLHGI